jgi:hypothetical protein
VLADNNAIDALSEPDTQPKGRPHRLMRIADLDFTKGRKAAEKLGSDSRPQRHRSRDPGKAVDIRKSEVSAEEQAVFDRFVTRYRARTPAPRLKVDNTGNVRCWSWSTRTELSERPS